MQSHIPTKVQPQVIAGCVHKSLQDVFTLIVEVNRMKSVVYNHKPIQFPNNNNSRTGGNNNRNTNSRSYSKPRQSPLRAQARLTGMIQRNPDQAAATAIPSRSTTGSGASERMRAGRRARRRAGMCTRRTSGRRRERTADKRARNAGPSARNSHAGARESDRSRVTGCSDLSLLVGV